MPMTLSAPTALTLLTTGFVAFLALGLALLAWRRERAMTRAGARLRARLAESAERESRWRAATDASGTGIALLRPARGADGAVVDFTITDANADAARLLRRTPGALADTTLGMLGAGDGTPLFAALSRALDAGVVHEEELRTDPRCVATSWLHLRAVPVADGLAVAVRDIRAEKRERDALARASVIDPLTGLHNRRGFETIAEQQLRHQRRRGREAVLFYLDCDDFKPINDVHGHATGDRALQEVARVLRHSVRDSDLVARLGGDEFVILALDAEAGTVPAIERRLQSQLARVNMAGVLPAPLAVSVGHVRVSAHDERALAQLLEDADAAQYVRKRSRRAARRAMAALGFAGAPVAARHQSPRATGAEARAAKARADGAVPGALPAGAAAERFAV